jgi:hypothetical protein
VVDKRLIVVQEATMGFDELAKLAKELGFLVTMIGFFLYRDYKRELNNDKLLAAKDSKLDKNVDDTHKLNLKFNEASIRYENVCKAVVESLNEQTKVLKKVAEVVGACKEAQQRKPKVVHHDEEDDSSEQVLHFRPTPMHLDQTKIETVTIKKG